MGWNTNEGYYEKHVRHDGYKITELQGKINKLKPEEVRSAINIISGQKTQGMETKEDNLLEEELLAMEEHEPIEYIIETEDNDKELETDDEIER